MEIRIEEGGIMRSAEPTEGRARELTACDPPSGGAPERRSIGGYNQSRLSVRCKANGLNLKGTSARKKWACV